MNYRIGFGYDVHQLVDSRDFWLGGIKIPFEKGALGHSDADVLIHVICDAILGAANLGDIGTHFPDNSSAEDIAYRSIAVALSDLAAMGAYPSFITVGLTSNKTDIKRLNLV